jgi:hypothetical protein
VSRLKPDMSGKLYLVTTRKRFIEDSCICGRRIETTEILSKSGITRKTREGKDYQIWIMPSNANCKIHSRHNDECHSARPGLPLRNDIYCKKD